MKKLNTTALVLAAGVLVAPVSHAVADQMMTMPQSETAGWYIGGGGGAKFEQDQRINDSAARDKAKFNPGYSVNLSGGYAWENGLRAEGELWHSSNEIDHVEARPLQNATNGNLATSIAFANGLYDFHTGTMFTPYLGAGVGIAYMDADNIGILSNGSRLNDQQYQLAYQGIAGVAMQLDHNWAVTADYRYIGTTAGKFREGNHQAAYMGDTSNNVVLGVRYSFDQPKPMQPAMTHTTPPMAQPMPPQKPMVAPVPESYMVFFDFNKSNLTPEAKRILASAAQEYKSGNFVRIVVTGHTDTSGSNKYNQKLSMRRADAVKAELARLGVNRQSVVTRGVGKDGLLVPTADGVREAQNRRAEIVFDKQ